MHRSRWLYLGVLLLTACGPINTDSLARGRRQLRSAPCPDRLAVTGAAGVNEDPRHVYLGDWVLISVCRLDELLAQSETQQKPIHLFVQGIDTGNPIAGIDRDRAIATFILERTDDNKGLWQPLLYNPIGDRLTDLHVGVGLEGGQALAQAPGANLQLQLEKLYVDWTTYVWIALLIVVMIGLFWFGSRTDLVRAGPTVSGVKQAYSLGRVQMAWWFFMVLLGYVFIWLVTGDQHMLTPSVLGLMGISAATALASAAIVPEGGPLGPRRRVLADEIAAIEAALERIAIHRAQSLATEPQLAELAAALDRKTASLHAARAGLVIELDSMTSLMPSQGFWRDLVSDERGSAALDRFQIVAWTLVLGGVFLWSVLWELTMPEFSATMLMLMGISSGTYIGFKFPKAQGT
jgi:hypothetical protein